MTVKIWIPGTDKPLDDLFEQLRTKQFQHQEDHLWYNYSESAFTECEALCIAFDEDGNPEFCSSILKRDCWPENTYRILNRLWKTIPRVRSIRSGASPGFLASIAAQAKWLDENRKTDLIFISRSNDNWQSILLDSLEKYGMPFQNDSYKYLTCKDQDEDTCWQYIIYRGDVSKLNEWKRKCTI